MIIDSHTHLGRANNQSFTTDDLLKSMSEARIDYSFVIADKIGDKGLSTDGAIEMTKNSEKLRVIGNVDMSNFDQNQIKKLCDYLSNKKIIGVKLYLGYEAFYAYDERLFSLYQFCSEHNYPIMYHTGMLEMNYKGLLKYAHPLTIDEVAVQFPRLNIIIAHMGNPWIMDCAAVILKNKHVYADISGLFEEYKTISSSQKKYVADKLYDFGQFAGFSKCLFGTDWPLYDQKEYLDFFYQINMTDKERDVMCVQNACRLFNLFSTPYKSSPEFPN